MRIFGRGDLIIVAPRHERKRIFEDFRRGATIKIKF
jgi:hypothetical protein